MLRRLAMWTAAACGGLVAAPATCAAIQRGAPAFRPAMVATLPPRALLGASCAPAARGFAAGPLARQDQRAAAPPSAYAYDGEGAAEAAAEIGEVDFDPALANTVRLIGTVGGKKDLKVFERSKLLPFAVGIKDRRRKDEADWINVEAWGPLAERANEQLNRGDQVAVTGRLRVDKWTDRSGAKQTSFKVVAAAISKVRPNPAWASGGGGGMAQADAADDGDSEGVFGSWDPQQQASAAAASRPLQAAAQGGGGQAGQEGAVQTTEEKWMDFFERPDEWWDNRTSKTNLRAPDFKRKTGGRDATALWIDSRDTPEWVGAELKRLEELSGRLNR